MKDQHVTEKDISCNTLENFVEQFTKVNFDDQEALKTFMREFAKSHNMKYPKFMKILRLILTGHDVSYSLT